jgi:hypothetical protein
MVFINAEFALVIKDDMEICVSATEATQIQTTTIIRLVSVNQIRRYVLVWVLVSAVNAIASKDPTPTSSSTARSANATISPVNVTAAPYVPVTTADANAENASAIQAGADVRANAARPSRRARSREVATYALGTASASAVRVNAP